MRGRFQRGVVIGKFSPLHSGHELLIGEAQAACTELLILSWSKPEFRGCERDSRERWLARLFPAAERLVLDDARLHELCAAAGLPARDLPANDAPDEEQRAFVGWLCASLLRRSVDAVFTSEDYGDPLAAVLTAHFRKNRHDTPAVSHVCVDRERIRQPVSATMIRADVHAHRRFLSQQVYGDFVDRVCILGGESSGKTSLAMALARRLETLWVPEYGRELWLRRAGVLRFEDMLDIAVVQVEREEGLARDAYRWLICDTSPLTTLFYSLDWHGRSDPRLDALAERPYARVILCSPDFAFVQDGSRQTDAFRMKQDAWYRSELARRNIPFCPASGPVASRVEQLVELLDGSRGDS